MREMDTGTLFQPVWSWKDVFEKVTYTSDLNIKKENIV